MAHADMSKTEGKKGFIKSAMENMEQQFSEGQLLSTSGHETQSLNSIRRQRY
ncbi:unnamed protein product [Brassica oleracea]